MKNIYLSRKRRTKKSKRKTRSKRQRGGNPDEQDDLDTSLFEAIKNNNFVEVKNALQKGADVNRTVRYPQEDGFDDDPDEITPLIHAIISGYERMVKLLLTQPTIIVGTHDELALAEKYAPEDHGQNEIHSLIKDYIKEKKIKEAPITELKKLIKKREEEIKNTIPSLAVFAAANLTSEEKQYLHRQGLNINERNGTLSGGKRRTRKAKRSKRKKVK
jgi:ankyrin repeat protein